MLGLLLAHHRPETTPCLSSITSSKFVFYLVFIFESGNSSIFLELLFFFTLQKKQVSFDSGVPLSLLVTHGLLFEYTCIDLILITVPSRNLTYDVTMPTSLYGLTHKRVN